MMKLPGHRRIRQLLFCLTFAVLSPGIMSQESGEETATSNTGNSDPTNEDTQQPADHETGEPDSGKLRQKKLGEAFEEFTPSEEISADNVVPFPTDI
ncbi:MAG: hypothetical protein WD356_06225 [Pseudomonadales bacterium]